MAEPFLGEIRIASFVFAPKGWALCNGQLLPINQNQGLFSLLGTTFGGDGRVNFALPDLRGRAPLHVGAGHALGERAGASAHTLSTSELPQHTHALMANAAAATVTTPSTTASLASVGEKLYTTAATGLTALNAVSVATTGGTQAHMNMQPFITLSFIIALEGIFPSPT